MDDQIRKNFIKQVATLKGNLLSDNEKEIAIKILEHVPFTELEAVARFIFSKQKIAFVFDNDPIEAKDLIIKLVEDKKKRINVEEEIATDENKLLIGDDYSALKSLLLTHKGKIDVIYLDATNMIKKAEEKGASRHFKKEKDKQKTWLPLINKKLKMIKDLLSNEGTIFVSIDQENEAYLVILMNDLFGEAKFFASLPRHSSMGISLSKHIMIHHEYLLVYSRRERFKGPLIRRGAKDEDERGKYYLMPLTVRGFFRKYREEFNYEVELDGEIYKPRAKDGKKIGWSWSKERMEKAKSLQLLVGKEGNLYYKKYLNYNFDPKTDTLVPYERRRSIRSSDLFSFTYANFFARRTMKKINPDETNYQYYKSIKLITTTLQWVDQKDALILDLDSESPAIALAVMKLNQEDEGKRNFIICLNNEDKNHCASIYEYLYRVIKGKTTTGKTDFEWLAENNPYLNEKVRTININDTISIQVNTKEIDMIISGVKKGLLLLNCNYDKKDLELFYDLATLNPLLNREGK